MDMDSLLGQPLDFDDVASALLAQGADHSPAHLHGGVCGVLAGGGEHDPEYCLAMVAQSLELDLHGDLAEDCLRLAALTLEALADENFEFHLFLPDDETELALRVAAVADWCSAFLRGYAAAVKRPDSGTLDGETAEVLRDIAAISEAALDAGEDDEEAESDFFEVTEYLRFATLNLFMDHLARQDEDPA